MSLADLHHDLDADLAGSEPDYNSEPLAPEHTDGVDRMLRHLRRLRRELDNVHEVAAAERQRIDEWVERHEARIQGQIDWFERSLAAWHAGLLERSPKEKTVSFPNGTLKARAQQPEWVFDEPTFMEWAEVNAPEFVRVKPPPPPEIDKTAAKKFLKPVDGEVVTPLGEVAAGVEVRDRPPKFTVEVTP